MAGRPARELAAGYGRVRTAANLAARFPREEGLDLRNADGKTPLMAAAATGNDCLASELVKAKADVNAVYQQANQPDRTAMDMAACAKRSDIRSHFCPKCIVVRFRPWPGQQDRPHAALQSHAERRTRPHAATAQRLQRRARPWRRPSHKARRHMVHYGPSSGEKA